MSNAELTEVSGIKAADAEALVGIGITTLMDLVLAPRATVRAALKAAKADPLPTMGEIATWQDRARQLRLESPPSPGWDREASFVVSFERRASATGEERQTVVAQAESDAPLQYVHGDWNPDAAGEWIGERVRGADGLATATPFNGPGQATLPAGAEAPDAHAGDAPDNVIRHWNAVALEANRIAHTTGRDPVTLGPTGSARALAIVHLAMHDAYVSIAGGYTPYLEHVPAPASGASAEAAADAAAQETLKALYPSRAGDFERFELDGPGLDEGRAHGREVARRILDARKDDPGHGSEGYVPKDGRGYHRVDPANPTQGYYGPFVGATHCFAVRERYELEAPPKLDADEYLRALREVRGKGMVPELMGTLPAGLERRTPEETVIGQFWAYDGPAGIGTPPRLYNQIVRDVSAARRNSTVDDARLFALVNVAMADAGILAWAEKYRHDFWRPVLGIREHDPSMGAKGAAVAGVEVGDDCDPAWLPLGAPRTNSPVRRAQAFTPPFPAYPSGHATFGAAALQSVRLFYHCTENGPDELFRGAFVSDELDGVAIDERGDVRPRHERRFPGGLWQMIEANGRSRVYLGVHWVFDAFAVDAGGRMDLSRNVGGVPLGLRIAKDLTAKDGMLQKNAAR